MSDRDQVMWNADPLLDEMSRGEPRFDDGVADAVLDVEPRLVEQELIGLSLREFGTGFLGTQAIAGKTLLSAFGMGGVAQSIEDLQVKGGVLPDWAMHPSAGIGVPDHVIIARDKGEPIHMRNVAKVMVYGGKHIEGTGYRSGEPFGTTFSSGVASPIRVDVTMKNGKKGGLTDVKRILFLGGSGNVSKTEEAPATTGGTSKIAGIEKLEGSFVMDDELDQILGELGYETVGDEPVCADGSDPRKVMCDLLGHGRTGIIGDTTILGHGWTEVIGDDYIMGTDILGAAPPPKTRATPRAGFVVRKTPAGNKHVSLVLGKPKANDHKKTILNARDAGKRAVSIGNKLKAAIAKSPKATTVRGDEVILGAAPPKRRARKFTVAQLKKIANNTIKRGNAAIKGADKHVSLIKTVNNKMQSAVAATKKKTATGSTKVMGTDIIGYGDDDYENTQDLEFLGELINIFGDEPPADAAPADAAPADAGSETSDYGFGPPPTVAPALVPGQDYVKDPFPEGNDPNFYGTTMPIPLGAVYYDNSKTWNGGSRGTQALASWNYFLGPMPGAKGGGKSGFYWNGEGWRNFISSDRSDDDTHYPSTEINDLSGYSSTYNWGPLIGNPTNQWKNLRFDAGTGGWFWFRDTAPAWATAADDMTRLNKAILDRNANVATAAADEAAQAAADQLEAEQAKQLAKDQGKEDADTARKQQQEATGAEHQAKIQSVADTTAAAQKAAVDEAAARQAASRADIEAKAYGVKAEAERAQYGMQAEAERAQFAAEAEADRQSRQQDQEFAAARPEMAEAALPRTRARAAALDDEGNEGDGDVDPTTAELREDGNAQDYEQDEQDAAAMDAE